METSAQRVSVQPGLEISGFYNEVIDRSILQTIDASYWDMVTQADGAIGLGAMYPIDNRQV
jgi:hypothetical protein